MDKKMQKNQNQTREYTINFRNKEIRVDQRSCSKSELNVESSNSSQTVVNLSLVLNLLDRFKKEELDFDETYLCISNSSFFSRLESRDPHYNKEILSLNRIKEDNEKILKERIAYLEYKLGLTATLPEKDQTFLHKNDTNKIDKFIIQTKNSDLRSKLEKIEKQFNQVKEANNFLQHQIASNKQQHQFSSKGLKQNITYLEKMLNEQRRVNSQIQIEMSQSSLKYEAIIKKLEEVIGRQKKELDQLRKSNSARYQINFPRLIQEKEHKLCIDSGVYYEQYLFVSSSIDLLQYSVKLNLESQKVNSLEQSNSTLRKQMIKLHNYIEEQDEKYQQNVKKLQEKIKRMDNSRVLSNLQKNKSKSRFTCFTSRDNTNSAHYLSSHDGEKQNLSDFKRNFDLNLSGVRKNTDHDQKVTISSTFYGSK